MKVQQWHRTRRCLVVLAFGQNCLDTVHNSWIALTNLNLCGPHSGSFHQSTELFNYPYVTLPDLVLIYLTQPCLTLSFSSPYSTLSYPTLPIPRHLNFPSLYNLLSHFILRYLTLLFFTQSYLVLLYLTSLYLTLSHLISASFILPSTLP